VSQVRIDAMWIAVCVASSAHGQVQIPTTPDKTIFLGKDLAGSIQAADGYLRNSPLTSYVQSLADKVGAPGLLHVSVRITNSSEDYAVLLPHSVLIISSGMIRHAVTESELAAILAHSQAHSPSLHVLNLREPESTITRFGPCALAARMPPASGISEDSDLEGLANATAIRLLRSASYDPLSLVSIISKLRYEHSGWDQAFRKQDLDILRAGLEAEPVPRNGYILDSSRFSEFRTKLDKLTNLGTSAQTKATLLRRSR
jgi:predicted Zn-dependent protease